MRYAIVIEKTATGFSAFVPDLPGCIATGRDQSEVETEMKNAIRFHIDGLKGDGLPVLLAKSIALKSGNAFELPHCCKAEFATVELLMNSDKSTRFLDASILSWIKYEKQLRKLLCFLLFQHTVITEDNFSEFNEVIVQNRKLYPQSVIAAIDALKVGPVSVWVGEQHKKLQEKLDVIELQRNKHVHGQVTGKSITSSDLKENVLTILKWVELLAQGSRRELGYDGLVRDTFTQAKKSKKLNANTFSFNTPIELDTWLKCFTK